MFGSLVGVAMNSGTQTIPFQAPCEILQSLLSNSMKKAKHPQTNKLALVHEGGVALCMVIILMTCCGGVYFTCVHSSRKLTHLPLGSV